MFRSLRLRTKLALVVVAPLVGLGVIAVTTVATIDAVRFGSEQDSQRRLMLDIRGNLEPAALSIDQSFATSLGAPRFAADPAAQRRALDGLAEQDRRYQAALASYDRNLSDPDLRRAILVDFDTPAQQFWTGLRNEYIPAIARGDIPAALTAIDVTLLPRFQEAQAASQKATALIAQKQAALENDVDATVVARTRILIGAFALVALLTVGLGVVLLRSVSRPLRRTAAGLDEVAQGNLRVLFEVDSDDEVGSTANALNRALASISGTIVEIGENADSLAAAAEEMSAIGAELKTVAEGAKADVSQVVTASDLINANVTTVASSMVQMGASANEIAAHTADAATITANAVAVAHQTRERMSKLAESSQDVGNVMKVINSIAEQTNLLALNATIEAARAGEAGKGFAVVANEVKELARQTGRATEDISTKIGAIQADTGEAVKAIDQIATTIDRINAIAGTIASAVEEQTITTNDVSRNLTQVGSGTGHISASINALAGSVDNTSSSAASTEAAARELARMAVMLRELVSRFDVKPTRTPAFATEEQRP